MPGDEFEEGSVAAPQSSAEDTASPPRSSVELPGLRHREGGELGRGGMARVTSGFDPVLERSVALKRSLHGTPAEDARLLREARLTAQLDHPAIASVLDVGLDANGAVVCVLNVRQGVSLGEAVRASPVGRPSMALLRALLTASQALAHAHARGVLHRDVSPNNVRLGPDGEVWVLDWGLAATLEEAKAGGFRGGTAGATSPEQRTGGVLSPASDVWSLGALLHLVCARSLPGERVETAPPAGCARPLWALCRKALSADAAHRYVDAGAFAAELARWLDGQPLEAWPEGPLERVVRIAGRRPRLTLAVVTTVVLALAGAVVATGLVSRAQRSARESSSRLLLSSAERALSTDELELAGELAAQAMGAGDDARARGVLAAVARARPVDVQVLGTVSCEPNEVLADGGVDCLEAKTGSSVRFATGVRAVASQALATLELVSPAQPKGAQPSRTRDAGADDEASLELVSPAQPKGAQPSRTRDAGADEVASLELVSPAQPKGTQPSRTRDAGADEVASLELVSPAQPKGTQPSRTRDASADDVASLELVSPVQPKGTQPSRTREAGADDEVASLATSQRLTLPGGTPVLTLDRTRRFAVLAVPDGVVLLTADGLGPLQNACRAGQPVRFAVPRGEGAVVFCGDDELVLVDARTTTARLHVAGLGTLLRGAVAGDLLTDDTLLVSTVDGHLGVIDLRTQRLRWVGATGLGFLHTVVASFDGRTAALIGERGAGLFLLEEGHVVPLAAALQDVWRRGADSFTATTPRAELLQLTARRPLVVTKGFHGRSALALHEGSRLVAVGDGLGAVQLAHLDDGALSTLEGPVRVIKSLAFSTEGRFLMLGAAGPGGVLFFEVRDGALRPVVGPWDDDAEVRGRHVAFLDDTHAVFFGWGAPPRGARFDGARFVEAPMPSMPGDIRDVAMGAGQVWALDASGAVTRVWLEGQVIRVERVEEASGAERLARSLDGTHHARAAGSKVWRVGSALLQVSSPVEAIAVANDGRLALCRRDGVVELRDVEQRLLFSAPAHEQRCARVAFCDQQRAVCSVGWDGRLRVLEAR